MVRLRSGRIGSCCRKYAAEIRWAGQALLGEPLTLPLAASAATMYYEVVSSGGFADVPLDYWAGEQIEACVLADIVGGYTDGTYRPTVAVTRDQMAVYVARAFALPL